MYSLVLGFTLILLVSGAQVNLEECEKKGFASTLLCSSCDKLASFVGDSEIVEECQMCCLNDESNENMKVKQISLLMHPFLEGRMPEIRDFIDKHRKDYKNLIINTRASVYAVRLQITYENGKSEIMNINDWKSDKLRDFCDSVLEKADSVVLVVCWMGC